MNKRIERGDRLPAPSFLMFPTAFMVGAGFLAGGCGVLPPFPTARFSETTNFLPTVEFFQGGNERSGAEMHAVCFRFVDPNRRLIYDGSPDPESASFGGIGPHDLSAQVNSDFETEIFTFRLTRSAVLAPAANPEPLIEEHVPLADLTDDEFGVREVGTVTLDNTIYIYSVEDGLSDDECISRTTFD